MMSHFFDATRFGGLSLIRVNADAIAYLAEAENGTSIRLIGGETLRVNEDRDEIERRALAPMIEVTPPKISHSGVDEIAKRLVPQQHNPKHRHTRKVA